MFHKSRLAFVAISTLICTAQPAHAESREFVTYEVDTDVSIMNDLRTRGVTDSLFKPAIKLTLEVAHESGLVGMAELVNVSKKEFPDGNGLDLTLGAGYRFGDPEAWHFGVGLAAEIFPGAKFTAPHGIDLVFIPPDMVIPVPVDERETSYNSNFIVLEINYGALEGRILDVVSSTYRGADTGGVCGAMLLFNPDPMPGLECYARGDRDSRGTLLFDLDYRVDLTPATSLKLHAGYQKVANFSEADFADYAIGLTRKQWGFEWGAEYVTTRTKTPELFMVDDGGRIRRTDNNKLVFSVKRSF